MVSSAVSKKPRRDKIKSKPARIKEPKAKASPVIVPIDPTLPRRWVIVQLTSNGEREKNIASIVKAARQLLGRKDVEVCVPAVSQKVRDDSHTMFYWDGYVFIEFVEGLSYMKLQDTTYFQAVLCQPIQNRQRKYSFLRDEELEPMRAGLQALKFGEFQEDNEVKIIKGQFKNLIGTVSFVDDAGENVQVFVGLRSKKILMDFPSSYLVKI